MILSFINIRKFAREVLKTSGFALGFQHFHRDLANVNEWKIMFDPSIQNLQLTYPTSKSECSYFLGLSSFLDNPLLLPSLVLMFQSAVYTQLNDR